MGSSTPENRPQVTRRTRRKGDAGTRRGMRGNAENQPQEGANRAKGGVGGGFTAGAEKSQPQRHQGHKVTRKGGEMFKGVGDAETRGCGE